ncbi:hypothetical protein THAOC_37796 [Thalassiosira oceanica]|uniref:Uncharacterized protein n=1 Tax=Thalassiosira oceanica TaxID=159749 RepID=K0QZM1_THAOC|nr:hypothetical protein THAOC_37796 [Thalassiosira oceanica]|eukprot:EJK43729.1 hypothetical protein THAOC_37796 [Thalassiosira oceanica]
MEYSAVDSLVESGNRLRVIRRACSLLGYIHLYPSLRHRHATGYEANVAQSTAHDNAGYLSAQFGVATLLDPVQVDLVS